MHTDFDDSAREPDFVCTPLVPPINFMRLCDGVDDCVGGDDETTVLCESKLRIDEQYTRKFFRETE